MFAEEESGVLLVNGSFANHIHNIRCIIKDKWCIESSVFTKVLYWPRH